MVAWRLSRLAEPGLGISVAVRRLRYQPRSVARHRVRWRRARWSGHRLHRDVGTARRTGGIDARRELVVERPDGTLRPRLGNLRVDRRHATAGHAGQRSALDGGVESR